MATSTYNLVGEALSESDGNGVTQKTSYTYDKNGNKLTETNWLGNTTTYVYDPLNRVIEKIDANGKTIEKLEYNINDTQSKSIDAVKTVNKLEDLSTLDNIKNIGKISEITNKIDNVKDISKNLKNVDNLNNLPVKYENRLPVEYIEDFARFQKDF